MLAPLAIQKSLCDKTSYLNEEVHCTEPSSPSVSIPWFDFISNGWHQEIENDEKSLMS
jgi:hypothetical protein